ncbi:gastrula zinc finger protein XlCGF57.1-like [Eleginops maclovinus]|uniref:gastrula zinc finger protein XlCGF57.1-like n=1 Tax=Eleginops maclovinus TaxID=56733 RepID=UPI003080B09F
MCKVRILRELVKQRLTAAAEEICVLFERTIAEYEEELSRAKGENERQRKLLHAHAAFQPQLRLHRADVQQLLVVKENVPPEQEWSSTMDQEDQQTPTNIKEEQEELWSSQEGEQLQVLEEADITLTLAPVKSEDDEEKPQSSDLNQRPTDQITTEADGEDCGEPEPASNLDPDRHLQSDTEDNTGDSSESDTEDSADWNETRKSQSGSNSLKKDRGSVNDSRSSAVEKKFLCSECGKRFGHRTNLRTHMMTHTGEKPFSCLVCKKSFTVSYRLQHHMRIHTGEKPYSCLVCKKTFRLNGNLYTHMKVHKANDQASVSGSKGSAVEQPFACVVCRKRFSSKKSMNRHSLTHTGEKAFSCSVCDKGFSQKGDLNIHVKTHTGEKPFSCSVCNKNFLRKGHLKRHAMTHTGETPFSCTVCEKSFTRSDYLKEHMNTHTGEKPFSCSVCRTSFKLSSNLKKHARIHTGKKPFSCSVCKKSFILGDLLKRHMRTHTGEKPFKCCVCNKTFAWAHQVKKHKCKGPQSSQLNQTLTEEEREAEPVSGDTSGVPTAMGDLENLGNSP